MWTYLEQNVIPGVIRNNAFTANKYMKKNSERRKEKSRDAARCRRSKETEIFHDLASLLPLPSTTVTSLDKASIMRLAISFLKTKHILDMSKYIVTSLSVGFIAVKYHWPSQIREPTGRRKKSLGPNWYPPRGRVDITRALHYLPKANVRRSATAVGEKRRVVTEPNHCFVAIGEPIPHPANYDVPLSQTFLTKHSLDMKFTYADETRIFILFQSLILGSVKKICSGIVLTVFECILNMEAILGMMEIKYTLGNENVWIKPEEIFHPANKKNNMKFQVDLMGQSIYEVTHPCDHSEVKSILSANHTEDIRAQRSVFIRLKCTLTSKGRNVNVKAATYKVIHCTGHLVQNQTPASNGSTLMEPQDNIENQSDNTRRGSAIQDKDDSEPEEEVGEKRRVVTEPSHCFVAIGEPIPHPANYDVPLSQTFLTKHSLDMKFTYADETMEDFLGFNPDIFIAKSVFDFHHAQDSFHIQNAFKNRKYNTTTYFLNGAESRGLK
ncbi:hypoxia-inducible factor 1-alpha-like [Diaphorina citri]|uniref:Hypoxia-inducible factor 1-alpha-like n=1 Tax=Diaphorina citri TaxID=121845 RepID=A0A3Q0IXW1_DIACI|nr:hypoxia-inducible factor 1-alpha-like [Diaphorina citri]